MSRKGNKLCCAGLVLVGLMAASCASVGQATPASTGKSVGNAYAGKTLATSYTGALDASGQLMLGMLKLEGTDKAVTAEQTKSMQTVMQALPGWVFKADAERNAVWANVEQQLTSAQLSAIADMHLAQDDVPAWMQDNPMGTGPQGMPGGAGPQGTPPAGMGQGGSRPHGTPGARQGGAGTSPGMGAGSVGATSGTSNTLLPALVRLLTLKTGGDQVPLGPMTMPIKP